MKRLLILVCLFAPTLLAAQIDWKKEIWPCAALTLAGSFDGVAESVKWHYHDQFSNTFPNNNPEYWDPDVSWRNKYENGIKEDGPAYFGSTTFLAWTTDGYHLMRSARNIMV